MGDNKKLFDIDEFWKDLKLDKYGIEDIDEFEIDEIGKKIEESLDLEEFEAMEDKIEMPSPETFAKWVELGEDKYRKRLRRKRILGVCATLLIVCIGAVVAINCIKPPVVDAGLEGGIDIESTDMETTNTYSSWSDLPQEIQDQFIEVKDLPDGYEVEQIVVEEVEHIKKVVIYLLLDDKEIIIKESVCDLDSIGKITIPNKGRIFDCCGVEVWEETSDELIDRKLFKFVYKEIAFDVGISNAFPQETMENVILDIIKLITF